MKSLQSYETGFRARQKILLQRRNDRCRDIAERQVQKQTAISTRGKQWFLERGGYYEKMDEHSGFDADCSYGVQPGGVR